MIRDTKFLRLCDALFILLLVCAVLFLLWKAPYGYHMHDEPLCTAIAYRHVQGDALLADEWNPVQLSSFLLAPLMRLYLRINPTAEGLILHFRYIYIVIHSLSALAVYALLRKRNAAGAVAASLLYLLYAPNNIMALSYNTMGVGLSLLCVLLLLKAETKSTEQVLAGLLFAGAVLCVPFLAVVYLAFTLASLLPIRRKPARLTPRLWGFFTLGVLLLAAAFFLFGLRGAEPDTVLASLPYILHPANHSESVSEKFFSFFEVLFIKNGMYITTALFVPLVLLSALDRKKTRRCIYLTLAALLSVEEACRFYTLGYHRINSVMIPIAYAGAVCLPLTDRTEDRPIRILYLSGWVLALCFFAGSNTGTMCIGSGLCLSACAAVFLFAKLVCRLFGQPGVLRAAVAAALLFSITMQTGTLLLYRKNRCLGEPDGRFNRYCPIEYGCGKGEICGEINKVLLYDNICADSEDVRMAEGEYVLYFTNATHLYLMDQKKCAAFSTWVSGNALEEETEKLLAYWELHPERKPDAIYIGKDFAYDEALLELLNPEHFPVTEKEYGYTMIREK